MSLMHSFFPLRRLFSSRTSLDRIASCSSGEGSLLDLSSLGLTHVPRPERMATVRGEVDLSGNKVRTGKKPGFFYFFEKFLSSYKQ